MMDIQQELEWEQVMIDRGIDRFRRAQQEALDNNRATETSAGSRLMTSYVQSVKDHIIDYLDGKVRQRGQVAKLMSVIPADMQAMIAMKAMLGCIAESKSYMSVAKDIGSRIEDEIRLAKFKADHGTYFDQIMRNLQDRNNKSYEYQRNSIMGSMRNQKDEEADYWSDEQKFKVGQQLVHLVVESSDLFELERYKQSDSRAKKSMGIKVKPTATCVQWITEHNDEMQMLMPDRMPMIQPPMDWVDAEDGGYVHPQLRMTTPLIIASKIKQAKARKYLKRYNDADMPKVLASVNAIQRTGWRVNERVLSVLQDVYRLNLQIGLPRTQPYEIPPVPLAEGVSVRDLAEDDPIRVRFNEWKSEARALHILENERKAKVVASTRTLRMAQELKKHDAMYYVYRMDFRGRTYTATTGLSPQGDDVAKGLLHFAKAKRLGKQGAMWMKINGANKYGTDKIDLPDRINWIDDRRDQWLAVAGDPISNRSIWAAADKPYQFLAWCFEYAEYCIHGDETWSRMPVGLDGSCNGLQHFSAMLRDEVGGAAVNLMPSALPADIYQSVGDVASRKLRGLSLLAAEEHQAARNWLKLIDGSYSGKFPRKLAKPPVMTLPYGSTQRACVDTTAAWLHGNNHKPDFPERSAFQHCLYLSPIIWESIGEVVIAARAAMDWLQKCAGIVAKKGKPLQYTSAIGFPVHQASPKMEEKRISTILNGRVDIRLKVPGDKVDSRLLRQGSSPNFVHNCDSTHMHLTVNDCEARIEDASYAMIHDDFGVHACDTPVLFKSIREQFVWYYTNFDVLADFKAEVEERAGVKLPEPPSKGTLDINLVLGSRFFFA